MDTSNYVAKFGSPTHPDMRLWEKLYQEQKDEWTSEAIDKELLQFQDILTDGKTGLDVFIPMCGKSQVMLSFAEKGHRVVGIEWSELPVKQFFEENGLAYSIRSSDIGGVEMPVYTAHDKTITIYCGDLFAFKEDNLGGFDCIFDHGSIGSFDLTKVKRTTYAEIMDSFTKPGGRILLSFFDYEHSEHPTVPFATTEEEVANLYGENFKTPELLHEIDAAKTADLFNMDPTAGSILPVWTLSRFSWKLVLLVKH